MRKLNNGNISYFKGLKYMEIVVLAVTNSCVMTFIDNDFFYHIDDKVTHLIVQL